jgi:hypothetical protein
LLWYCLWLPLFRYFKNVIGMFFSDCWNFICFILSAFSVHSINFSYMLTSVNSCSVILFYSLICSLLFLSCGLLQAVNGQVITLLWLRRIFRPSFALVWNTVPFLCNSTSVVQCSVLLGYSLTSLCHWHQSPGDATHCCCTILKNTASETPKNLRITELPARILIWDTSHKTFQP